MTKTELEAVKQKMLKAKEAQESMRTVANLFSASIWKLLPQRIKDYFEEYREG